jgi:hypothetical protein
LAGTTPKDILDTGQAVNGLWSDGYFENLFGVGAEICQITDVLGTNQTHSCQAAPDVPSDVTGPPLRAVWGWEVGAGDELWAVGPAGYSAHYANGAWDAGVLGTHNDMNGISGLQLPDGGMSWWAVGQYRTILHKH